jgi:hypothetical protein
MADPISSARNGLDIVVDYGLGPVALFAKWFYLTFLPFVIQYIGIPMFALGVLLALAFAGGTMLFVILFFIFMFYFIKGTIFNSKPKNVK